MGTVPQYGHLRDAQYTRGGLSFRSRDCSLTTPRRDRAKLSDRACASATARPPGIQRNSIVIAPISAPVWRNDHSEQLDARYCTDRGPSCDRIWLERRCPCLRLAAAPFTCTRRRAGGCDRGEGDIGGSRGHHLGADLVGGCRFDRRRVFDRGRVQLERCRASHRFSIPSGDTGRPKGCARSDSHRLVPAPECNRV